MTNRYTRRFGIAVLSAMVATSAALAQNFPWPGANTDAPKVCTTCAGSDKNLPTFPFSPSTTAITRHVGRFLDSTSVRDWQGGTGLRTLRARNAQFTSDKIYMIAGEGLASYNRSGLFSKLGKPMASVGSASRCQPSPCTPIYEQYLQWDAYENAEDYGSGWDTPLSDGQKRLFAMDVDERGYIYLAYHQFSWGIVSDSGGDLNLVRQVSQHPGITLPTVIGAVKGSGKYYALVSDPDYGTVTLVYDVSNPSSPMLVRSLPFPSVFITKVSSGGQDVVGINTTDGKIRVYTVDSLVAGSNPLSTITASDGRFYGLTSDGSTFYAPTKEGSSMKIAAISASGTSTEFAAGPTFRTYGIRYGGGHLSVIGLGAEGYPDLKVYRVTPGAMQALSLGDFFVNYYTKAASPDGVRYAKPPGYIAVNDAVTHQYQGKTYLFYSVNGLGDVYELSGSPGTPPPACVAPTGSITIQYAGASSLCNVAGSTCQRGETVSFQAVTTNPIAECDTVEWNFGDGSLGYGKSVSHVFNGAAASYVTSATVRNTAGSITTAQTVNLTGTVAPPPPPPPTGCVAPRAFSADMRFLGTTSRCSAASGPCQRNEVITFTATPFQYALQACDTVRWNFGDGNSATGTSVTHTYTGSANSYTATITISNSAGSESGTRTISFVAGGGGTTPPPPSSCSPPTGFADLTYSGVASQCSATSGRNCNVGEMITFRAAPFGYTLQSCDTVDWNFGDGTTGTGTVVSHVYSGSSSSYVATITIRNSQGSQTGTRTLTFGGTTQPPPPAACSEPPSGMPNFVYTGATSRCTSAPGSVCQPNESISFTAVPFRYTLQDCDTVEWNFGDGTAVATGRTVAHTFAGASPSYTITITIRNKNGSIINTGTIAMAGNPAKPAPTSNIAASTTRTVLGTKIMFTGSAGATDTISKWIWDFGDGWKLESPVPTVDHTYSAAGTFNVSLIAVSTEGLQSAPRILQVTIDAAATRRRGVSRGQ